MWRADEKIETLVKHFAAPSICPLSARSVVEDEEGRVSSPSGRRCEGRKAGPAPSFPPMVSGWGL